MEEKITVKNDYSCEEAKKMILGITKACMCMQINILVTSFKAKKEREWEKEGKMWKIKRSTRIIEGSWSI